MNDKRLIIQPKPPKGEDGYRVCSIRIKEQMLDRIEEVCAQTGYSRNKIIGLFISFALEHYSPQNAL